MTTKQGIVYYTLLVIVILYFLSLVSFVSYRAGYNKSIKDHHYVSQDQVWKELTGVHK